MGTPDWDAPGLLRCRRHPGAEVYNRAVGLKERNRVRIAGAFFEL